MKKLPKSLHFVAIFSIITFLIFPNLDLQVSGWFYDSNLAKFPWRETFLTMVIYKSIKIFVILVVAIFLFFSGLLVWRSFLPNFLPSILNLFKKVKTPKPNFVALVLVSIILTPGIIVHWVMKPIWDRPRPVNIVEFGGKFNYEKPFHFAETITEEENNSFPSGHAATAFIMVALAFLAKNRRQFKTIFTIIFLYGTLVSSARIWQGGHFLSDVTISMILSLYTVFILAKFLKIYPYSSQ